MDKQQGSYGLGAGASPIPETEIGRLLTSLDSAVGDVERTCAELVTRIDAILTPDSEAPPESQVDKKGETQLGSRLLEVIHRINHVAQAHQNVRMRVGL